MVKYFLYMGLSDKSAVVGLKYDSFHKRFTIGGYTKFEEAMESIVTTYFPESVDGAIERKKIQKNKMQIIINGVSTSIAFGAFAEMRKANLTLTRTATFYNLMR